MRACTPGGRATTSPPRKKKRNRLMKCDELGWNATTGPHGEENKPTCQCICNTRHTYIYIYIYTHTHIHICVYTYTRTLHEHWLERENKKTKKGKKILTELCTLESSPQENRVSLSPYEEWDRRETHIHTYTHTQWSKIKDIRLIESKRQFNPVV